MLLTAPIVDNVDILMYLYSYSDLAIIMYLYFPTDTKSVFCLVPWVTGLLL